ncbi:MAG: hypothetical protein B9S34_08730 [Opitutia bacterium Tous-C1TDCM]|nr:MAG: hypothetical protein B9S34_08730 [Opitutae bacterium Tous-C1TDCM]
MSPAAAQRFRLLASAVSVLVLVAVLAAGWFYWRFRASLPQLDGTAAVAGLGAGVTVTRDALGVPTVRGADRRDVTRALGWLHAQDRFFQMDLLRRSAAGELSALFGERALARDRAVRRHGFRAIAREAVARATAEERALLEAFTAGVNSGLAALGAKPFEYFVLRAEPQPWRPEDSLLIIHAMTLDLQDDSGGYEQTLMTLRDVLGRDMYAFLAPLLTPGDAALDGTKGEVGPIPGPKVFNLRNRKVGAVAPPPAETRLAGTDLFARPDAEFRIGSNAFAVSGTHTADGTGLLANDMHLGHSAPNIWYRAVIEYGGRRIAGVMAPGAPAIVAGSNGYVAWGVTNSAIDVADLVEVDVNSIAKSLYRAPGYERLIEIGTRTETIEVKGGEPVKLEVRFTVWGPIVGQTESERPLALRWTAHDSDAANIKLIELEAARTVADAVRVAHRAGVPSLNFLAADRAGDVAWTIAGKIPKRVGYDGRLPVSWTFGDRRWDGYLSSEETPVVTTAAKDFPGALPAPAGRVWSGNQRQIGGAALALLGDGAYARGARAAQIRDALEAVPKATPADLFAVQLDHRALFLARWHALMLEALSPAATSAKPERAALRAAVEKWDGAATTDSTSYRLVREFRLALLRKMFTPVFAGCREIYPDFTLERLPLEAVFWKLWAEKPLHWLNPDFGTWEELAAAAGDDVLRSLEKQKLAPAAATWGKLNTARIGHPFARSMPWLAGWLQLPEDPLPGGDDMPRAQRQSHGVSQRLVVAPGREEAGIFHMPAGQSGHPLSPFFRAGHAAWVKAEATPLLAGPAVHTLTLRP